MKKDKIVKVEKIDKSKLSIAKKDSVGLFSGKFITKEFADKKDLIEKIEKKKKQKGYDSEI